MSRQPTLSLYEDPEQWVCRGHRLAEVVIVVDRQQVAVDVGVANHHLHVCNAMDVKDEFVKLFEFARLDPVHRESAELCPILGKKRKRKDEFKETRNRKKKQRWLTSCIYLSHPNGTRKTKKGGSRALSQLCRDLWAQGKSFLNNKKLKEQHGSANLERHSPSTDTCQTSACFPPRGVKTRRSAWHLFNKAHLHKMISC